MSDYQLHPLCTLFPRLEGAEFAGLVEDIRANGLRQPITLCDGKVLDGGNRYRACIEAGVDPTFVEFAGQSIVSFVLSANLHRRHLSPGQQAAIVASAQDWSKAHPSGEPLNQGCNVAPLSTVADRASQSGASKRTQQMADKVVKADPGLGAAVARGEVSLPAAVKQVSPPKPTPAPPPPEDPERSELDELRDQLAEMTAMCDELRADNESMAKVFESNEQLAEALAEAKKYREQLRIAESRITGLMNEKNEQIRRIRGMQRTIDKLEKASGSSIAA